MQCSCAKFCESNNSYFALDAVWSYCIQVAATPRYVPCIYAEVRINGQSDNKVMPVETFISGTLLEKVQ